MSTGKGPETEAGPSAPGPGDASRWLRDHGDALYRYARARVRRREDAEDLVQETLLAALRAGDRFQGRSSERTWLISILRHKILDHLRRRSERSGADADLHADAIRARSFDESGGWRNRVVSWREPSSDLAEREFREALDGCLGRLPGWLSAPFVLRELEGRAMDEIRTALDLTPGNLRIRLHRARLQLRECLERTWLGTGRGGPT